MRLPQHAFSAFAAIVVTFTCACAARCDTTIIRELAKNSPHVNIVISGPIADDAALTLQSAILRHPDNKHAASDIAILTIDQARQRALSDPSFSSSAIVFILAQSELTEPLPSPLAADLPNPLPLPRQKLSTAASWITGSKKQAIFNAEILAPDALRLQKASSVLQTRAAADFRSLPFSSTFRTNKLALFSSDDNRDFTQNWGAIDTPDVWNDIVWHSLSERSALNADDLDERSQVYFIDRADRDLLPTAAGHPLAGIPIKSTTIVISHDPIKNSAVADTQIVVFSMPNRRILQQKLLHFPTPDSLAEATRVQEAIDLRQTRDTTLIISGAIPEPDRPHVGVYLDKDIHNLTGVNVEESGPGQTVLSSDIPLEQLQGQSDAARTLRHDFSLRYVWHFTVTDYRGNTDYTSSEKRISPDPAPFSETEPTKPSRSKGLFQGNKSDDQYQKEMTDYQQKHDQWQGHRDAYTRELAHHSYDWERTVNARSVANVAGILRLVDLQQNGLVVWQYEGRRTQTQDSIYASDRQTVRGADNRPSSIQAPVSSNSCPPTLLHLTTYKAGRVALETFLDSALLPTDPDIPGDQNTAPVEAPAPANDNPSTPTASSPAEIAEISNGTVILNVGLSRGLKVGSKVTVPLKTHQIKDPSTGKVLEERVLEGVTLRVVRSTAVADCVPVSAQDQSKMSLLHVGMTVLLGN